MAGTKYTRKPVKKVAKKNQSITQTGVKKKSILGRALKNTAKGLGKGAMTVGSMSPAGKALKSGKLLTKAVKVATKKIKKAKSKGTYMDKKKSKRDINKLNKETNKLKKVNTDKSALKHNEVEHRINRNRDYVDNTRSNYSARARKTLPKSN
tara:strand:+ start:52 stop:507 length:456 start_codon:yes stop_codon:yes gene_type:complete